jgi:antitoxin ParD1/3/4
VASITIKLPKELSSFIDEQVASGAYPSEESLITRLLRQEKRKRAEDTLVAMVRAARASGEPQEVTPERWERIEKKLLECGVQKKKKKVKR